MKALIIISIIIIAFSVWTYVSNKKWKKKLAELNNSRPKLQKEEFVNIFIEKGYSRNDIEIAYDKIKKYLHFDNFSLHPDDDIYKQYEIDPEDFSDMIFDILKKLKRKIPSQKEFDVVSIEFKEKMKFEAILKILSISKDKSQ